MRLFWLLFISIHFMQCPRLLTETKTKRTRRGRNSRAMRQIEWEVLAAVLSNLYIFGTLMSISRDPSIFWDIQGSPDNMTPLGIEKSVIQTECHFSQ